MMNERSENRRPRTSKRTLFLLIALFTLPFILGTALFWLDWRPAGSAQHGELVQPPRPLPETGLHTREATPLPTSKLKGKWLLVMPRAAACDAACIDGIAPMQQVHRALGKEQSRVQPVLIAGVAESISDETLAQVGERFPELVVASVAASDRSAWQLALGNDEATFIVDPFGNVMMRYRAGSERRGVLKDLERLLKYSWVR